MTTRALVEYHPNGYPTLGLVPRTLRLHYREGADVKALRRKLELWERRQGNRTFEARHLEKLPAPLAFELVNVYVAMRERYPEVRPDFVEFSGKENKKILATATNYCENLSTVREFAANYADVDPIDTDLLLELARGEHADAKVIRQIQTEAYWLEIDSIRDPFATGSIEFGSTFNKKRSYQKLLDFWALRNQRALNRGLPVRVLPSAVSPASFTLIHEFGHLVEAELLELGYRSVERAYRALSEMVFETKNIKESQWRYHLINYPTYDYTKHKGRYTGGPARRRETKRILHLAIRTKLGAYATTYRDELFAEAFAFAYGGRTNHRRELKPFLRTLQDQGLAVERLPQRTW